MAVLGTRKLQVPDRRKGRNRRNFGSECGRRLGWRWDGSRRGDIDSRRFKSRSDIDGVWLIDIGLWWGSNGPSWRGFTKNKGILAAGKTAFFRNPADGPGRFGGGRSEDNAVTRFWGRCIENALQRRPELALRERRRSRRGGEREGGWYRREDLLLFGISLLPVPHRISARLLPGARDGGLVFIVFKKGSSDFVCRVGHSIPIFGTVSGGFWCQRKLGNT